MLIVDSQVHIWETGLPTNPAHRQVTSYTVDDLLKEMDEGGIDAAVVHPPGWDPNANDVAVAAAEKYPDRLAVLGNFPLDRPDSPALLEAIRQRPGMLGLRFTFQQPHQQTWMTDGTMDWLWPAVEAAGLPVALSCAGFMPAVGQVAERYPGVRLIVDHMGRPVGKKDAEAWESLPQLVALVRHPNVAVKVSGAPGYTTSPYPFTNIHGHLRRIYDTFGPERMFWGTDITRMPCSWRQCVTLFTEELPWLTEGDKELIMGGALCKWLGWSIRE